MKAVLIGEGSGASRAAIMAVYPRHKAVVDAFKGRGEVIGIGRSRTAAIWPSSGLAKRPRRLRRRTPSFSNPRQRWHSWQCRRCTQAQ